MEESDVVFEVEPEVFDSVFEHSDSFDAHTESESRVLFGVDAALFEDIGVDHPASHNFEPSGPLADVAALASAEVARNIDFGRRFGEGEVRGSHTDDGLFAEHLLGEVEYRLLHIGERHPFIDVEAFDLMENAVSAVRDGFVAEYSSRADDADRRFLLFHCSDLNGGGVGTQQDVRILFDEEGVLHIACRMFRREVERRENVSVVFDFGPVGDGVSESCEDVDYLVSDERYGVSRAHFAIPSRSSHIADGLVIELSCCEFFFEFVYALRCSRFEGVEFLSEFAFVLRCDGFELFEKRIEFAFFSEDFNTELLDGGGGVRCEILDTLHQVIDFVVHKKMFKIVNRLNRTKVRNFPYIFAPITYFAGIAAIPNVSGRGGR